MRVIQIEPAEGGKKTAIKIEMATEELEQFMQAVVAGKLASIGITVENMPITQTEKTGWSDDQHTRSGGAKGPAR